MMLLLTVFLAGASVCLAYTGGGPVDCAFSVWSEWLTNGQHEVRTRDIFRQTSGGGRPCSRRRIEYRAIGEGSGVPAEDSFLSRFLPGNRPSYSLGGGNSNSRYTLSRDILVMLDTTVGNPEFPYYKAFASNLLGKLCGDIGANSRDNQVAVATYSSRAAAIHDFDELQSRASIQDEILRIRSSSSNSDLFSALSFSRTAIVNEHFGIRRYSNSTKEVLIFTSYKDYCARDVLQVARRLGTLAVVYVVVVGEGRGDSPPADWCLEDNVASDPSEFHFLHLENVQRLSYVSRILLGQSVSNNKFCRRSSETD